MKLLDYILLLVSQALGLAAVFLLQAIPVFLFGPWLSSKIGHRCRSIALWAGISRVLVTLLFAGSLFLTQEKIGPSNLVFILFMTQLLLEFGSLVFQNCRNLCNHVRHKRPNPVCAEALAAFERC